VFAYAPQLFAQLDRCDLPDTMPNARRLLARHDELLRTVAARQTSALDGLERLAQQLAADELTLDDAATAAAQLAPWLTLRTGDGTWAGTNLTPGARLVELTASELQRRTMASVKGYAPDVYAQLVELAAECVERAHRGAQAALDLPRLVAQLRQLIGADEQAAHGGETSSRVDHQPGEGLASPHRLPALEALATLQADARRGAAWADAAAAVSRFSELHVAARHLRETTGRNLPSGPVGTIYGAAPRSRFVQRYLDALPVPLQLGVAVELDLRPGLYGAELFPPPQRAGLVERSLARVGAAMAPQG
jgi:hypothetical protein